MKLILTQGVTGLGEPGDIVEVKNGYGRNFLVPGRFAIVWSLGAEKQIVSIRRARKIREVRDLGHAQEVRESLQGLKVKLPVKAGTAGRLFGAVTVADIVAAVAQAGGPQLDKRSITVSQPIKSLGQHPVTVKLHDDVNATVNVQVISA